MRAADAFARMAALPVAGLDAILEPGPALVLAPHPDDESLGCGGLIAAARADGLEVHVAVLTDGIGSHPNSVAFPAPRLAALRQAEARAACTALGVDPGHVHFLGVPDAHAPVEPGLAFEGVCDALTRLARRTRARTLLTTWRHDPHGDHVSAARLARCAAARTGVRLWSFPVWGLTLPPDAELDGEIAGVRLDVAAFADAKRRAIAAHVTQTTGLIADDPHGFRITDAFLAHFTGRYETFLRG